MDAEQAHNAEGLALLDIGVALFDRNSRLVHCNPAFRSLRRYPEDVCREGVTLESLLRFNAERGDFGAGDVDKLVNERLNEIEQAEKREIEREMADGQILRIRYRRTASGGLMVTFEDRTEERRAQKALAASEERHTLVSRATSDGIYDWDVSADQLFVSERLARILDIELGPKGSRKWAERVHPDDFSAYSAAIRAHFKSESEGIDCEYRVRARDGRYRWIHDRGVGVRGADNRVVRLVGAVRDITDLKQAKAELDRTEARLTASLATISDGILLVDADDRVRLWNDRYYEIFSDAAGGIDLSDAIVQGRDFFDMIRDGYRLGMFKPHPEGVEAWVAARKRAWDQPVSQWELELANGRWILLNERKLPDGGHVSVYTDITDLKTREAEAQAARQRFEDAIESIASGFALFDPEDRLVVWNSRFREYFSQMADVFTPGAKFRDMIAASIERGLFPAAENDPEGFLDALLTKRAKGVGMVRENRLSDGLWLQIRDHRTKDGGLVSIYTDITDLKTGEAEAQAARQRFEDAIGAISSGFVLWDAEDRIVTCNAPFCEMYAGLEHLTRPGVSHRELIDAAMAKGMFPNAIRDPEKYLKPSLESRSRGEGIPREQYMGDGRWLQITDHRTRDGGLVSIYTDVTELKTRQQEAQAARERFEEAIEAISSGFALWDANDCLVVCNGRYRHYFADLADMVTPGRPFREVMMAAIERGLFPGQEDNAEAFLAATVEKRAQASGEPREQHLADGLWLQITDHQTSEGGIVSIYTDVTELKTRQDEAQGARKRFEEAIEAISSGFSLWDADDRLVVCNSRYRELYQDLADVVEPGVKFREVVSMAIARGLIPAAEGDPEAYLDDTVRKRAEGVGQLREHHMSSGLWLQITDHRTADGGIVSIHTDVTELKNREEELRRQSAILEQTLENMGQGISLVDRNLRTLAFNKKFFELLDLPEDRFGEGFTMEEAFRFNAERGEYGPGDVEEQVRERVELASKFQPHRFERTRPDGSVIEIVGNPMEGGGFVSTYTDITERKQAEERLKSTLAELNAVLDSIDYGVILFDRDLRARVVNRMMKRIWGFTDEFIAGRPSMREMIDANRNTGLYDVAPADWDAWIEGRIEQVRQGDIPPAEMHRGDGRVLSYQCVALPDGGRMLTYFDITEMKEREAEITRARDAAEAALVDLQKAQQRLIQAEKMASLGQLTAGIAHEIKNPLNFVNNFARLSDEMVAELAEILEAHLSALGAEERDNAQDLLTTVRENLGKIAQHGKRADSIVKNMLMHAREGPSERQSVGLNAIAEEALNLAYHGARAEHPGFNIEMIRDLSPEVGEIECYPQDLMRVFLNLISNGMYAADKRRADAGDDFAPTISVTTRANADGVEIEVRDNGVGIRPELRERIFIPFFTTKPAGEGTGLGLSLSYDIVVKQHGGDLAVESEPGAFTAFRVTLPRRLSAGEGGSP